MPVINRGTGSVLFRGLSSFWKRFFKDSVVLDSLYGVAETLLGDVYLDLMEAVLAKSLRNTVVFSKRDWRLLLLNDSDLSFDPAIYSSAFTEALGPTLIVTALELSSEHDDVAIEVSDAYNLAAEENEKYPAYGIYNTAVIDGIIDHEKLWTLVVPSGKSISDSITAVSRRIVTNKPITDFTLQKKESIEALPFTVRKSLVSAGGWNAMTNTPPIPAANAALVGTYYQVTVAGSTVIDGTGSWASGDWIVNRGDVWVKAPWEDPKITFRYGSDILNEMTIPAAAYGSMAALKTAIETAIANLATSMGITINISVTVDGGRILFTADKDLNVWDCNTAFETYLFMKPFRFKFRAELPPGREQDFPWLQTGPVQLLTAGFTPAGTEYRFPIETKVKGAKYIYNTLYEPSVVFEEGRHHRISGGYIYFQGNPFELENVAFRDLGSDRRQLALWMSTVSIDNLTLYYNYGYRFTKVKESSQAYKDFIRGIYYYYTHGPQLARLKSAFNILAGIPVVENEGEIVVDVSPNHLQVTTDKNVYTFAPETPASVTVGQVLHAFDAMTDAFLVEDYISNPHWYDKMVIPDFLMPGSPLGLRVSSVTTFIPNVGDPGFVVGDVTTDAAELFTHPIDPPLSDYSIATEAYFTAERDENGHTFRVAVPPSITTGASSLADMIAYLRLAMKQMIGNPVAGLGANVFRLSTTASFGLKIYGTVYTVTLTAAETSACASLVDLVAALQAKVNAAAGAGVVTVFPYLTDSSLILMPNTNIPIEIRDTNVAAQAELGLYPFISLQGVSLTDVGGGVIRFASTTVGAKSRIHISDMNQSALDNFQMQPFRQGSGDIVGDDGDPTPGWVIMDKYLKFNTFRIKFNASAIHFDDNTISIQDIVFSGRPLYTTALIAPSFELFESVVGSSDDSIEDVEAWLATISPNDALLADIQSKRRAAVYVSEPYAQAYRKEPVSGNDYIQVPELRTSLDLEGVSESGGSLHVESQDQTLKVMNHLIELTDLDHLKTADQATYSEAGVFNRGRVQNGISLVATLIPAGTIGGIYPVERFGDSDFGMWVHGFDLADLMENSTHIFVIDQAMKTAGLDPFAAGVIRGAFMTLKNMADPINNGEFAVTNYYRNVQYKRLDGSPVLVDIIAYANNLMDNSTAENFNDSTIPPAATIAFRPPSDPRNNSWLIVLPSVGTMSQRLAGVLASVTDHKDIFPFDLSFVPASGDTDVWAPPPVNTYYSGYTNNGDAAHETFFGHLYKLSWDADPGHGDTEALNPGSIPHGYANELFSMELIRGNTNWGQETYANDPTDVGQVTRDSGALTNPYLLGLDDAGDHNLYVDFDAGSRLDQESVITTGEVCFYRTIMYHFTQLAPTDKAEYFGPHDTNVVPSDPDQRPRPWPAGDLSTYRSFIWKDYFLPACGSMAHYDFDDPTVLVIGGGSAPNTPAPAGYTIGGCSTLWTLQIGKPLRPTIGTSLPSAVGHENDLYQIMQHSDTPVAGINAPVEAGYALFELGDWIYSDGTQWQRRRHRGTQAERNTTGLARRVLETENPGLPYTDPLINTIGANQIIHHGQHTGHNWLIWVDGSYWTRAIGARIKGQLTDGGFYDYCGPVKLRGYGPSQLDEADLVTASQTDIEQTSHFDWSQDTSFPGVPDPIVRIYSPGGGEVTVYVQIPEAVLNERGFGVRLAPGASLVSAPDSIRLLYYNVFSSNWVPSTAVQLDSSVVTGRDFVLKLIDVPGGVRRMRLWNGRYPYRWTLPFAAESGDLDQLIESQHRQNFVVIAMRFTLAGLNAATDYFDGLVLERTPIPIQAA